MKVGPKQSETVPAVYSLTDISEMRSHANTTFYTKESD